MENEHARRLTEELDQVIARLRSSDTARAERAPEAAEPPPAADSMDAIRAALDREIDVATRSLLVHRTRQLARALDRLDRGSYGSCEECGQGIAPARLAASPEATRCVRCQARLERRERARARQAESLPGLDVPVAGLGG